MCTAHTHRHTISFGFLNLRRFIEPLLVLEKKIFLLLLSDHNLDFQLRDMLERYFRNTETEQIGIFFFSTMFLDSISSPLYALYI